MSDDDLVYMLVHRIKRASVGNGEGVLVKEKARRNYSALTSDLLRQIHQS